ncbi:BTB/POZ domain-containing protein 3-like [Malaya genurostris]|uniref:BTB/POZ domain-containing protein 3-like n=1 Tax=Malaya genurostris TaxID=325434 RepID=UPI0026F38AE0|nr:BTB/POZ domain-containing protein 3-like [Malaya genurostris]
MANSETSGVKVEITTDPIPTPVQIKTETERGEFLLNNQFMSDVIFLVGPDKQRIYGHKFILFRTSNYFFQLFTNSTVNEFPIEDSDPNILLELLRFVYCGKIDLTSENVREIYNESKKFSLDKILEAVENFLNQTINSENVLCKLIDNRFYKFKSIDRKCLKIICDDPFSYIDQADFKRLDRKLLKLIVTAKTIYCTNDQLLEILDTWQKTNYEENISDLELDIRLNSIITWKKLLFFGMPSDDSKIIESLNFRIKKELGVKFTGLGLCYKSANEIHRVQIDISEFYGEYTMKGEYTFRNDNDDIMKIVDIFFKPIDIKPNVYYTISIKHKTKVEPFCLGSCRPGPNDINLEIWNNDNGCYPPIAYLYYKANTVS